MTFSFWHRQKRESELDEEIQSHLQMAAQDRADRGETARAGTRGRAARIGKRRFDQGGHAGDVGLGFGRAA